MLFMGAGEERHVPGPQGCPVPRQRRPGAPPPVCTSLQKPWTTEAIQPLARRLQIFCLSYATAYGETLTISAVSSRGRLLFPGGCAT